MKYSQNDEEVVILSYFAGRTGKFADVGAFHAFTLSNTRALYERGWSGVLVEPAPVNYAGIVDVYKDEPRIQVLNFAVGAQDGELEFFDSGGDAVSTSVPEHRDKWAAGGVNFTPIKVKQVGAAWFADNYLTDCDFLSIDTEATNVELFRELPDWVFERIFMLCIEHDNREAEIEARLMRYGFTRRLWNAENLIMAK
jgi:FkbM family methyltransferase